MLTLTETTEPHPPPTATAPGPVVPLRLQAQCNLGAGQPLSVGIPLPRGQMAAAVDFEVQDPITGWTAPCQVTVSTDRSWLQATFLSPALKSQSSANLLLQPQTEQVEGAAIQIEQSGQRISVDTGKLKISLVSGGEQLLQQAGDFLKSEGLRLQVTTARGKRYVNWQTLAIEERGPLRTTLRLEGKANALRVSCKLSCYACASFVRCELTLHNPRRARHPEGYWDLGDPGSLLFREVALEASLAFAEPVEIHWQERPDRPLEQTAGGLEIYQESSGGEHWQSLNHVNRDGQVPLRFRGYRTRTLDGESLGERASPRVWLRSPGRTVTCAVEEFWQKFPSAIQATANELRIKFWPGEFPDLHELQAGESCTRVVWLDFSKSAQNGDDCLGWVHAPAQIAVDPEYIADSARIPYFPPPTAEPRPELQQLLVEAIDGPRSFFAKRETIDEYSWRNFGDMWADHEEAYADDPRPVISHYNNQYDLLHGLLIQYLRSGDRRWWQLADPLARHVLDIDIYRTSRDKPAYNNGLFWHTAHYHAVGRATHRSMSNTMRGKRLPAPGTGPGNEHNYSSGLLLYHYLTGCPRARETVIQMAEWVLAMDDGERHLLGVLSPSPTGIASCTTDPDYHGPGRGAGNSIQSLLNGWKITGDDKYIAKAGEFIRRTIHPHDDLAARQLDNAELRWSYTVYLQALDRFVLETHDRSDLTAIRAYARQSLLHYARWMAEHDKFYLDEPEKLEYPTETWAAQELRKGTTLLMAARYAEVAEANAFQDRANKILERAWQELMKFESRVCTRPLALVLQQGYLETSLRQDPLATVRREREDNVNFDMPTEFVSQKQHIRGLRRSPRSLCGALVRAAYPRRWLNAFNQLWIGERVRCWFD